MLNNYFTNPARFACAIVAACALPLKAPAETLVGVTVFRELVTFDSATPGEILSTKEITGLSHQNNSESVRSIDLRPATQELYGVGNAPGGIYTLYRINAETGIASQVGGLQAVPGSLAFNFEPTSDRIRIVGDNEQNFRYNPANAALVANDGNLAYASGDPGFGTDPNVVSVSYTNSVQGASSTMLYVIDTARDVLAIQEPNSGSLTTVGPLGIDVPSFVDPASLEISPATGTAYMTLIDPAAQTSHLYTVNLGTGAATLVGEIGSNVLVRSITTQPSVTTPPEDDPLLWVAGADLARNEKPDSAKETAAINATVPEWSYGYRAVAAGSDLTLFTPEQHKNSSSGRAPNTNPGITGMDGWDPDAVVLVNAGAEPAVYNYGSGDISPVLPGQLFMHPSASNEFAVARWTAPRAASYRLVARWLDLDPNGGNGVSAHVVINGEEKFARELDNGGIVDTYTQTFELAAGSTVDFLVGSRGDLSFDSTGFNVAIREVPTVTMTDPGATLTEGENINVSVDVASNRPVTSVALTDNGQVVDRDDAAPYNLEISLPDAGVHYLEAVATDADGVVSVSNRVKVEVRNSGPSARRAAAGGSMSAKAASAGDDYFFLPQSGNWSDPNNWFRTSDGGSGVPGEFDTAYVAESVAILTEIVRVKNVFLSGKITGPFDIRLIITDEITLEAEPIPEDTVKCQLEGFTLQIEPGAKLINVTGLAYLLGIQLDNFGELVLAAPGSIDGRQSDLYNAGLVNLVTPPASGVPLQADFKDIVSPGTVALGNFHTLTGGSIVAAGGGNIVAAGGGNIVAAGGGNIISRDGAGLIGPDGASLIGPDGASLISNKPAGIVAAGGGNIVGNAGAGIVAAGAGNILVNNGGNLTGPRAASRRKSASDEIRREAAEGDSGLVLDGASLSGSLRVFGSVVNRGFVSPGSSAGGIYISGDYTQQATGTLVLDVGGAAGEPTGSDRLAINGSANLGGKLIVKTINGFTPQSGDTFSPLTYGAVSGSFETVSSNAQVNFGSNGMTMQVAGPNPPAPKALNIATRMRVETGDNVLIAGFIITGDQPKKVLVRGIGPSLPVSGALADPTLDLDGGAFFNDDWRSDQQGEIEGTTIPPSSDLESAIVATLDPGAHTAVLRGKNDGTGVGLVEVYDLESGSPVQLANISTRGQVQTGDNVMIGGFIIGGNYPAKVLLRAIGPSLTVDGALQDPTLELVDSNGSSISNDNWRATQEAEIVATTVPPTNDREAAIVATLVPGAYTAIVRGKDDTVGVALVEGYNLQ